MATTFEDWQSAYPALANLNFGKNSMTGGTDLFSGLNGLGQATTAAPATTADVSALGGMQTGAGGTGFGWNMNTAQLGLGALQSLGGLFNAFQSNRLARDQFNFTKEFANTNLNNSIQSYNTSLSDRANARAKVQGDSDSERDAYIAANRLTRG